MNSSRYFVLAGNAPYENRGCEAIVRGTVEILSQTFEDPRFMVLSFYSSEEQLDEQRNKEKDKRIKHDIMTHRKPKRFNRDWFELQIRKRFLFNSYKEWYYHNIRPEIEKATAVLSVGGDNYSLDYGIPQKFTMLDDFVLSLNRPIVIWGASVGPFTKLPDYERYMAKHLRKVTAIFARETATVDYLSSIGVKDNVFLVADPAFVMTACKVDVKKLGFELHADAIGINLSPLMARYIKGNCSWDEIAYHTLDRVCKEFDNHIYLIPHVTRHDSNDYTFLKNIRERLSAHYKERVFLIPPTLNAQEIKWIISHMTVFAGARTHSTIAALSSNVPTLSIAYSMKARGINQDLFGTLDYCLEPNNYRPEIVCQKISDIISKRMQIKERITNGLPEIIKRAYKAGDYLKQVVEL